ncbi:unnamed protein product [Trichogramma brassicae]|uniref:Cation-transporting P-type ATPase C-terminal domain-containing protein n=1 Tax=Trichogramma brassicae TaxID=86971 RepID=A0A6H5IHN3_9HYME|nr:unnamed protein product [Trichogramma brassicae]
MEAGQGDRVDKKDDKKKKPKYENLGFNTAEALDILQRDIRRIIDEYEKECKKNKLTTWPYEGNILFILVIFNSILVISDNRFRHLEILSRVKHLAQQIEVAKSICYWKLEHYPHLYSPLSPCITLQYTYRDGQMVNLPWALLVAGDIIVIRPGQQAPGYCTPFEDSDGPVLHAHEIYSPPLPTGDVFSSPQPRVPLRNQRYKLQETPYLTSLRLALDQALDRPVTCFNRERHLVVICCIEQLVYPILLILILIFNLLRYLYLYEYVGIGHWTELFLLQPVTVTLPLLPIAFPIWWIVLNCFGMARFKALFKLYQSSKKNQFLDPFEEGTDHSQPDVVYNWTELSRYFCAIMFGKEHMMTRSANILHVLGSVTALCCVDKKGILSWPNPTAEKVFFLHNANAAANTSSNANPKETVSHTSRYYYFSSLFSVILIKKLFSLIYSMTSINKSTEPNHPNDNSAKQEQTNKSSTQHQNDGTHAVAEVLDLTHDRALPFKLQFDDQAWRQHLNSLKPLGLAILLNTCNMETQEHYARFCCHVTCEAFHNENLVPVTNRRCLCELAKQIGFKDQAKEIFHLEQQLSTFRHVPETARVRDMKFARSLSISTKLKFPFPHMVAVVVREKNGGGLQLLTQGTADIILDSCIEFWDGHDLCPLTESEKKKVQDFYNRMSLTSYCTAFAYRPLTRSVSSHLSNVYLELPTESKHLFTPYRSPTPLPWDFRNVLDPRIKGLLGQFHSTDSLLCSEAKEDEVSSVEGCFELQCNQIFIGMVTMQYQAQTDMVTLIEQLERACIRFVHFSKENELRSRVFSEKMGLESGWNCHISLLSERDREAEQQQQQATEDSVLIQSIDLASGQDNWRSLSCLTDSTEQSAPVNFDLSNRAKLPRGIDKIRPHIELIDNVPLLVSLFTDCTTAVTREMLHIMQDYGEVVCVLGSAANAENMPIFMQADAAIAVEPLYPQVCQRVAVFTETRAEEGPSPIELSRALNSVACSLSIKREDPIAVYHLIMEARHYMKCLWNCVQFWLCCVLTLALAQALSAFLLLPPLFTVGHVLWLGCVIVPVLAVSLVGTPTDPSIMQRATGKNQCLVTWEVAAFVLWCYGFKFLPTIVTVLGWQCLALFALCATYAKPELPCYYVYPNVSASDVAWGGWASKPDTLLVVQHIALVIVVLHFVTISVGFVHREYSLWRKLPFNNWIWFTVAVVVLNVRYQKRARLEFTTKLGMNSPF